MPKLPYREEGSPPVLRPTVDVRLSYDPGEWTTRALIDTGSPLTIFDRGVAEALTIRIGNAGAVTRRIAMLGGIHQVQLEYVELSLTQYPDFAWTAQVAFITNRHFQMPFQGVLGAEGFLDKFVVTFNAYENFFMVEQIDAWNLRNEGI